jgi:hypothetical protein
MPMRLRSGRLTAPEIVVVEIGGGRRLERVDLAALRVDARHDVLDRAVLAGRVHGLEDQQQRPAILGVELVLQLRQQLDARPQELPGFILRGHLVGVAGIDVLEREPLPGFDPVTLDQQIAGLSASVAHRLALGACLGGLPALIAARRRPCTRSAQRPAAIGSAAMTAPRRPAASTCSPCTALWI